MRTVSRLGRTAAAVMVLAAMAGCAPLKDPRGTQDTVSGMVNAGATDAAMAALTRADYAAAERYAITALRYNPKDPTALLAAGLAYQGMGQYDLARQYYEVIVTNQVPGTIMSPGDGGVVMPRSVVDVARANMAAIDKITGRSVPRSIQESGRPPGAPGVGAPPFPDIAPMNPPGRPLVSAGQLEPIAATAVSAPGRVSDAEANMAGRFRILKRLLDEGLIAPEEYNRRRAANAGALLPFTQPPPSTGLDRPTPGDEAVARRLRDLADALERREMTPTEHSGERTTILDALLPERPRRLEVPPRPPKDMIEAGQAVGRAERLRAAGLVSDAELRQERDAIERSLDAQLNGQRVAGTATGLRPGAPGSAGPAAAAPAATVSGWGVALASAKNADAAQKAWAGIKAKFPDDLAGLEAHFKAQGSRTRIIAGPLASKDAARKLCKTLKLHRQACDPAAL
ncbi:MAG: SPOR domain-containing protein [Magnetospirillum sp.]|nr:SPOR domain-containing protein [Magnetospirillum sp.]